MQERDEQGFEPIIMIDGFFKEHALSDEFLAFQVEHTHQIQIEPFFFNVKADKGFHVTIQKPEIKEVTSLCFPKGWWYDRGYLLRIEDTYILWISKMIGTTSFITFPQEEELQRYLKGKNT